MRLSDGVQTSTNFLADQWLKMGACNVAVFPNQIHHLLPLPNPVEKPFTIGWAGSPGHFADLFQIVPALQLWLQQHPAVHLAVMTNELAQSFFNLDPARFHFTPFGTVESYLDLLTTLDAGIAPLLPTIYNQGRSDVKFLEYASRGVAGIYQNLEPYRDVVVDRETGLFYNTNHELMQNLDLLYSDHVLRNKIRNQGYDYVAHQRRIESHIGGRVDWYRSLLKKDAANSVDSEVMGQIESQGIREGNYHQIRRKADDEDLLALIHKGTSENQGVELQNPLIACSQNCFIMLELGQKHNDIQQPAKALVALKRTLQFMPYSSRAKSEIARSHFLLGDREKAVAPLKQTCKAENSFLPAWKYLLRLLAIQKAQDGIGWCKKADLVFPELLPACPYRHGQPPRSRKAGCDAGDS